MTETEKLQEIKRLIEKFNRIQWGHDGDCGSGWVVDEIEEIVDSLIEKNVDDITEN